MDKIWRTYKAWAVVLYQHSLFNDCRSLPEQDDRKPLSSRLDLYHSLFISEEMEECVFAVRC